MRVVVAMSGGVDSSVAAALLQRAGHEAIGVSLRLVSRMAVPAGPQPIGTAGVENFPPTAPMGPQPIGTAGVENVPPAAPMGPKPIGTAGVENVPPAGCCGSPADIGDAKRVCERLGIPHYVLDMSALFERTVAAPFVRDYLERRTPNPCVECNRSVKFGRLLALAEAWGASHVATGHYARIVGGRLLAALDPEKDQSYFLYPLTRLELGRVLFPVGGLPKREVRRLARESELSVADKPESMDACFAPGGDYRAFVRARAPAVALPGPIRDSRGNLLGRHAGLENYTVGQRRGLRLDRPPGSARGRPAYVTGLEPGSNALVVGPREETLRSGLTARAVTWTGSSPAGPFEARVRIRHRHAPAPALVTPLDEDRVRVDFREPQRAVAPGQAAVFYLGDEVLGGGAIEEAFP